MVKQMADERWWVDAEHDPIHEAAAEWFTRLQDAALTVEVTTAWQEWLGADPRHREAFRRIEDVWRDAAAIEDYGQREGGHYDPEISVSAWRAERAAAARRETLLVFAWAAIVTTAVVGGYWFFTGGFGQRLETRVGEHRSISLSDGSHVALGADTAIRVDMSDRGRRVELLRGEAFFQIAKDPNRPFSVRAGEASVTAVGTAFDVRFNTERVVVAVVEGRVTVGDAEIASLPVAVAAGEKTVVVKSRVLGATSMQSPTAATAWQSGRLSFDREPLRYVLEDVNRYATKPIVLAEVETGDLLITGTVLSDSISGWVASLESAFGLESVDEGRRILLKRVRSTEGT